MLTFQDGQELVLKAKGLFNSQFVVENKDGAPLIQLDPTFNWRKFHYNYDITYAEKPQNMLVVLLGVYASNYFLASMAGMA